MAVTYSVLTAAKTTTGSIAAWVNRSDLPTANILIEAEAMIFERMRVREMMARAVLTFAAADQDVAVPSGFLDPIEYRPYDHGYPLPFVSPDLLGEIRSTAGVLSTGTPSRWTVIGETAYVDVLPTDAMAGYIIYYKRPDPLSISNETNWLTIRYPSLLRYACMAKAYEHMKDQRAGEYLGLTMNAMGEAMATNDLWRRAQYV